MQAGGLGHLYRNRGLVLEVLQYCIFHQYFLVAFFRFLFFIVPFRISC